MADEQTPVVFLHKVERRYHQGEAVLEILKGAELAVWPGQSVALVAPSGAGKSTLLHITGLLEHPDGGEVYLDGVATSSLADSDRTRIRRNAIGFVYQAHHLLPEFSAVENVMLRTRRITSSTRWRSSSVRRGSLCCLRPTTWISRHAWTAA
jgi:lipoprotein-releasing system ATP-binding protein